MTVVVAAKCLSRLKALRSGGRAPMGETLALAKEQALSADDKQHYLGLRAAQ